MTGVDFTQINLHHSKGASAVLARRLSAMHTAISLIQEPWLVRGGIRGLAGYGKIHKAPGEVKPRACVAIKGINAELLPAFCSRDVVAAEIRSIDEGGGVRIVCAQSILTEWVHCHLILWKTWFAIARKNISH